MGKKIVFTVTNDLTYDQRMQKICRSLTNAGYEVELVGRQLPSSLPLADEPFKQTRLQCKHNKGKLFYLEYNWKLYKYLKKVECDCISSVDLDTLTACYFAAKKGNKKLAFDGHEYFTEVPEVIHRPQVQRVWRWVEYLFMPKADILYTVSQGIAEIFYLQYKRKFEVIMNAPLLTNNDAPAEHTEKFILYQGALNVGRGLEHLIEAMQDVSCKLKLAGEGDLSGQLRQQVKDLKLEDKVEFLGYVKPADLKKLTSRAYIGVNLLESKGLSYFYSLSNKFFDYIHARVPQLCIGFPEYNSINNDFKVAVMINSLEKNEIKSGLERMLNDKDFYEQLKANCEVARLKLNWQEEEKKLVVLYERVLG
jgi:glycosyltransferase involved in cell wall biosynthesis